MKSTILVRTIVIACGLVASSSHSFAQLGPPVLLGNDLSALGSTYSPLTPTYQSQVLNVAGGPEWLMFTFPNDFNAAPVFSLGTGLPLPDVTYLDISMPNSAYTVGWNLGLYDAFGQLVAQSLATSPDGPSGGGGSYAQLSFGLPAKPPRTAMVATGPQTAAGSPYANQNGTSLPPTVYFLAVTQGPTTFGANWTVTNSGGASAAAQITFATDSRPPCGAAPTLSYADINSDGVVDMNDFVLFNYSYLILQSAVGDLNADGITDDTDFVLFVTMYNGVFSGC